MSKSVVGFFPSSAIAQNAKHELVSAGYAASDIKVVGQEGSGTNTVAPQSGASETGFGATISNFFHSLIGGAEEGNQYAEGVRRGGALLSVTVPDGQEEKVVDLLESYGTTNVNDAHSGTASAGGFAASAGASSNVAASGVVPVLEEELRVGKRQVQRGGVRVYSHIVETPVEENIQLREEHVRVDRQPVNRLATDSDFSAFQEGAIELTETAEEAVVSKSARVVEEITVGKESSERTQTVRDTVRHTEVEVEQLGNARPGAGSADDEAYYRKHFQSTYASGGRTYESYAPAYQYGQTLANDPRYTAGNWGSVEAAAQKDWGSRGTGKWEDFKGAVQQGWNKVRDSATKKS